MDTMVMMRMNDKDMMSGEDDIVIDMMSGKDENDDEEEEDTMPSLLRDCTRIYTAHILTVPVVCHFVITKTICW